MAEADYILRTKDTVRGTAKVFMTSKSTVHNDVTRRLLLIDPQKAKAVGEVLDFNFNDKHFRGGFATKMKRKSVKGGD